MASLTCMYIMTITLARAFADTVTGLSGLVLLSSFLRDSNKYVEEDTAEALPLTFEYNRMSTNSSHFRRQIFQSAPAHPTRQSHRLNLLRKRRKLRPKTQPCRWPHPRQRRQRRAMANSPCPPLSLILVEPTVRKRDSKITFPPMHRDRPWWSFRNPFSPPTTTFVPP